MFRLPSAPIVPWGLADLSGTTALFATYASRSGDWSLGAGSSLAWGRCVRRTIGGSPSVIKSVSSTPNAIGCACRLSSQPVSTACMHGHDVNRQDCTVC